jgi:hypothetical protein
LEVRDSTAGREKVRTIAAAAAQIREQTPGSGPHPNGTPRAVSRSEEATSTSEPRVDEPDDVRLQQLLDVEKQLEDLVRAAEAGAAARLAEARAVREQRLADAIAEAKRLNAERARSERAAHEQALWAIEAAHRDALASLANTPDRRIDDLAQWALARAVGATGESA